MSSRPVNSAPSAVLLIGVVIAALAGAIYFAVRSDNEPVSNNVADDVSMPTEKPVPQPEQVEDTPAEPGDTTRVDEPATATEPARTVESVKTPKAQEQAEPAKTEESPEPEGAAAPEVLPVAPSVDIVRVEPDGSSVVAGVAEPGADVVIEVDDEVLATVKADADGNFVAIYSVTPTNEPQTLTLTTETPDGKHAQSEDVIVLLPQSNAPSDNAPAAAEIATDVTETPTDNTEPEPENTQEAPMPEIAVAVTIKDGAASVTTTDEDPREQNEQLTLTSISYAETGAVVLTGTGKPGSGLHAYADDFLEGASEVGADARWIMELPDLNAGLYVLRIDQVDENGTVTGRIETPFRRAIPDPPQVGADSQSDDPDGRTGGPVSVTVQPGSNLWTLAATYYGSGVLYTQIFSANSGLIRDPDLIYPGQVLAVPDLGVAE